MIVPGDHNDIPPSRRAPFIVEPFTDACRAIWEQRQHALFGVSPGNSYFQVALLTDLLGWLCEEFARGDVVVPDSALEHTYRALGYSPQRAATKARGETNVLRNRVRRAWENCGGPREGDGLHRMSELASHGTYRRTLAECEEALAADENLRETCALASRKVLTARGFDGPLTEDQINRAMRYLIGELPFFLASAEMFNVTSSLNFYHQRLLLADLIFSGKAALSPSSRQAYAVIRRASHFPGKE
ncbi:tRNA-dependent cyclodipeptide synthase [Saccharopolyspora gloriosae]|uniref:Cyclodipeptide synthase n=1 Tax=Saccharopolyspora gloriosae TaxID=455344 RepID=A0A840NJD8_9PSEU|nr:tRNA-dependent cyclodipeptide synthase [Saccharopolyspora gloriosae]MBB5070155.1 cyclo(L-tyrosyl-L-tyrosyl) synthase [Saccharopolyspora gloriosae]